MNTSQIMYTMAEMKKKKKKKTNKFHRALIKCELYLRQIIKWKVIVNTNREYCAVYTVHL